MQNQMHAWDCPCGVRNAPAFPACRQCGRPVGQGRPVFRAPAPPLAPAARAQPAQPLARPIAPPPVHTQSTPSFGYQAGPALPHPGQWLYEPAGGYVHAQHQYPVGEAFLRRFAAYLIDSLWPLIVSWTVMFLFGTLIAGMASQQAAGALQLFHMLVQLLLWAAMIAKIVVLGIQGRSIGKDLLGLKVVSARGEPPGFAIWLIRQLMKNFSGCFFGLGYLWMLFNPEQRTWHDLATGTWVVRL